MYAPDYISNSGGFISVIDEYHNGIYDDERIKRKLIRIKDKLYTIFSKSKSERIPISVVADKNASYNLCRVKIK